MARYELPASRRGGVEKGSPCMGGVISSDRFAVLHSFHWEKCGGLAYFVLSNIARSLETSIEREALADEVSSWCSVWRGPYCSDPISPCPVFAARHESDEAA